MEIKQFTGKLESIECKKEGENKETGHWKLWSYKIGGRYFSGFVDPVPMLNMIVNIDYAETPNKTAGAKPYKNIKSMVRADDQSMLDKQGTDIPTKEEEEQASITYQTGDTPPYFGMVTNLTCHFINEHPDMNMNDDFDKTFEHFWDLIGKKRKEKLGY